MRRFGARLLPVLAAVLIAAAPVAPRGASPAHEEPFGEPVSDPAAEAALESLEGPAPCRDGFAAGLFPCRGLDLTGYVSLARMRPGSTSGSNLWGFESANDGREYALFGLDNGTAVVDVTNPARPEVIASVPGLFSRWREVKVFQRFEGARGRWSAWAYVVTEAPGAGLQVLDLSDLPRSVSLAATLTPFKTAHTVTIGNVDPATGAPNDGNVPPVLYVQGFDVRQRGDTAGILAFDLSDPAAPALAGTYTSSYAHDTWTGVLRGERARGCAGHDPCQLVVAWAGDAIRILDFTDKSNPVILADYAYPELGYAHSGWIAADGRHLFSMDESDEKTYGFNSRVRVLDMADLRNPRVVSIWSGPTGAIDHNGYTLGQRYIFSNYERGVEVLDATDPLAPRETAFFDTFPSADDPAYHGAWGVYPFLPGGTILASNIDGAGGLFLLTASSAAGSHPRAPVVPPPRSRKPRFVDGPGLFP